MAFLDNLKETLTNKPTHLREPIVFKSNVDSLAQLEALREFANSAQPDISDWDSKDLRALESGIDGESQILFELSNSHLPMLILQDLRLEVDDLTSQIDFLVITHKVIFVIECKNLYGDIEVNDKGDFIRTTQYKGHKNAEGIYSPVTQNTRHLDLIKNLRAQQRTNFITKSLFENSFAANYQSLIVLANPKTVLQLKYAPKMIKNQIIRADQLVRVIKEKLAATKESIMFESAMYELAELFVQNHQPNPNDYLGKYNLRSASNIVLPQNSEPPQNQINQNMNQDILNTTTAKLEQTPLYQALKAYRYEASQAEGVKAYFIFNNADLEELIRIRPNSIDDLKTVRNFGNVKCEKYGKAILEILGRFAS